MMVRSGKAKGRYIWIWYGCGGQGANVRFGRCPSGSFREELVMLMRSNGRSLFGGEDILRATEIETRTAKIADR